MTELDQLTKTIHLLSTCEKAWDRPALEKAVLLWGGRTHNHVKTIEGLLDRQLKWLEQNEGHPRYEERFADWISNLRLYERTWDVLREVYGLNIGVPVP